MATIYDHIAQNKRRTWLLVLLFPLTFVALGYVFLLGWIHFSTAEYRYDPQEAAYHQVYNPSAPSVWTLANQAGAQVLPWLWGALPTIESASLTAS